jgi:hypothetical protein
MSRKRKRRATVITIILIIAFIVISSVVLNFPIKTHPDKGTPATKYEVAAIIQSEAREQERIIDLPVTPAYQFKLPVADVSRDLTIDIKTEQKVTTNRTNTTCSMLNQRMCT